MLRNPTPNPSSTPDLPASAAAPVRALGPRPIDPADFKFIGGGSPRGGWPDPTTTATTSPTSA
jgi:hypothetical protein